MKNLDLISEELFNKIRGRFPSVTIGDSEGNVTNVPKDARYFDFDYKEGDSSLGKISVSITDEAIEVMYADNFVGEQDELTKTRWYDFLKELRQFSKKRLLRFDTRNINKSNLDSRDYAFLATNRGDNTMSESKMYGTSRTSYQDIGTARLVVKHAGPVNHENAAGRTQNVHSIYIESANGERFKYPFVHLAGARAMQRHVANGGLPYDTIGESIIKMSEEIAQLKSFTNLSSLDASNNLISSIDLINNTYLNSLNLASNRLQSMDLTSHIYLKSLQLQNNAITSLDLSNNSVLTTVMR